MKDEIFRDKLERIVPFQFNEEVCRVFDDMAARSIPYYKDVQKMVAELAVQFYQQGSNIYDMGCSTGATILEILKISANIPIHIHGYDISEQMIKKATQRIRDSKSIDGNSGINFHCEDITDIEYKNPSVIIFNYSLQFIDPVERFPIIKKIYSQLNPGGILIVSDKILQSHTLLSRVFVQKYYNLKKNNGYTDLEIAQKREALDNVLIPYSFDEEYQLFRNAGFNHVDVFFSWYNFSSFICFKDEV